MDWEGDCTVKKAIQAWARLRVQFASITLGHLITVFCDASMLPVIKYCCLKPSVLLSLWSQVKNGVQLLRRNSHMMSHAWNNHIPIGVLQIYLGPTWRPMVLWGHGGRLPTSACSLSKGFTGASFYGEGRPRISETESLFFPLSQAGMFHSFSHFPFLWLL